MTTPKRVSPKDAKALVDNDGYTLVDVRTEAEFALGHPQGAYNVPYMIAATPGSGLVKNPDFARVMRERFALDRKLVLSCRSGQRSLKAAIELMTEGYLDVVDQRAGMEGAKDSFGQLKEPGWQQEELPVATEAPGRTYAEVSKPR